MSLVLFEIYGRESYISGKCLKVQSLKLFLPAHLLWRQNTPTTTMIATTRIAALTNTNFGIPVK